MNSIKINIPLGEKLFVLANLKKSSCPAFHMSRGYIDILHQKLPLEPQKPGVSISLLNISSLVSLKKSHSADLK
jgi:hypothetical protein